MSQPSRPGVSVGIDVGTVRIGVAVSDPDGLVATPVETVPRARTGDADLRRIADVVADRDAARVLVGLPVSLTGDEGPAAAAVRDFAAGLAAMLAPLPVLLVDERLSTVSATRSLRASGVPGRRQRSVVDQAAAVELLQAALDRLRTSGGVGESVTPGRQDALS